MRKRFPVRFREEGGRGGGEREVVNKGGRRFSGFPFSLGWTVGGMVAGTTVEMGWLVFG